MFEALNLGLPLLVGKSSHCVHRLVALKSNIAIVLQAPLFACYHAACSIRDKMFYTSVESFCRSFWLPACYVFRDSRYLQALPSTPPHLKSFVIRSADEHHNQFFLLFVTASDNLRKASLLTFYAFRDPGLLTGNSLSTVAHNILVGGGFLDGIMDSETGGGLFQSYI